MQIEGDFYFTVKEPKNSFYKSLYNNFLNNPNYIYHELCEYVSIKFMINEFELKSPLLGHEIHKLYLLFFIEDELIGHPTFDFILEFVKTFFNFMKLCFLFVKNFKIINQKSYLDVISQLSKSSILTSK